MSRTHPFEVLKYCPKCGSDKFKPQGERSLKCGLCGFHYFINSAAAVAALIIDEKKSLMLVTRGVEPDYGKLDLPGGFIDPGEKAEEAVVRELYEELGLNVTSLEYLGTEANEYVFSGFSVYTLDLGFRVKVESLDNLKAMDDILDYKFYTADEVDYNQIPAPSIKKFVKRYFNHE